MATGRSGKERRFYSICTLFIISLMILSATATIYNKSDLRLTIDENSFNARLMLNDKNDLNFLSYPRPAFGTFSLDTFENTDDSADSVPEETVVIPTTFPVSFKADGKETTVWFDEAKGASVQEALEKAGLSVGDEDEITLCVTTELTENTDIEIVRVDYTYTYEEQSIPYETITKKSDKILKGKTQVQTQGKNGLQKLTYRIKIEDGEEVLRELIKTEIVRKPVTKVILEGTVVVSDIRETVLLENGEPLKYKGVIEMTATAYTYGENGKYGDVTSTGKILRVGFVAVDPKIIPIGSKLYIKTPNGSHIYGFAIAEDTGGGIKGAKIDLFMETKAEVRAFGRRAVKVYILE